MTKRNRNLLLGAVGVIAVALVLFFFFWPPSGPDAPPFIDLSIQKQTRQVDTVAEADTLDYLVVYANNGNQPASGVVLMETVPEGTTFDSDNSDAAWHCDAVTAGSTCTLAVDSLAAASIGSADFAVVVDADLPDDVLEIVNVALIDSDGSGAADTNLGNNRAQAQTAIARTLPPPDTLTTDTLTTGPLTPERSGVFCELCKDTPARSDLSAAVVADYREQCALCLDLIDRTRSGYTLVVSSRLRREEAEEEARRYRARLEDPALPISILVANVEGVLRYRVAIGQVAAVPEAVALRSRLSGILPADTWVTRIR